MAAEGKREFLREVFKLPPDLTEEQGLRDVHHDTTHIIESSGQRQRELCKARNERCNGRGLLLSPSGVEEISVRKLRCLELFTRGAVTSMVAGRVTFILARAKLTDNTSLALLRVPHQSALVLRLQPASYIPISMEVMLFHL